MGLTAARFLPPCTGRGPCQPVRIPFFFQKIRQPARGNTELTVFRSDPSAGRIPRSIQEPTRTHFGIVRRTGGPRRGRAVDRAVEMTCLMVQRVIIF